MDASHTPSRFALEGSDGKLLALVAEGLPAWPDDITTLTDAEVGELEAAYMEQVNTLLAAEGTPEFDAALAMQLHDRVLALRAEAVRRYEVAAAAAPTGDAPAAAPPAGDPPAPTGGAPGEPAATDPAAADALASLRSLSAPPAGDDGGTPIPGTVLTAEGLSAESIGAAAGAAAAAAVSAVVPDLIAGVATALAERPTTPAQARRAPTAADLARVPATHAADQTPGAIPTPHGHLIHSGDVPGYQSGHEFTDMDDLVEAFVRRHRDLGRSSGEDEKVVVASYNLDEPPPERDMRGLSSAADAKKVKAMIAAVVGPEAIGINPWNLREAPIGKGGVATIDPGFSASGGLSAPVEPYYPQLALAQAATPTLDSIPSMVADRGGIRLVLPPSIGGLAAVTTTGQFTDGVTNTDTSLVSATAAFTGADVGSFVTGAGIPNGTKIITVTNGTTVVLSQATTATATGVTFVIAGRNPNNLGNAVGTVTAAQDAAGPPNTIKYTFDIAIGSQVEHDVYSVYTSLQFANLTARTFPEQVEVNIRVAAALAARVREQNALNYITGWSTLMTGAKTFGTARQLLAQFEHMAAYVRNTQRMDPSAVLRLGLPHWVINNMRSDYISSFIGGKSEWGLSDDELNAWFADRHVLPFFYQDGPTDISQLFTALTGTGSGTATNVNGVNNATPVAIPDYPGQGASTSFRTKVVSFMWPEGTWLGLTTGELNLGLVRDSILNSQNRFRSFEEAWETPAFVGISGSSLRCVHTVAADGTYGAAASVTLGVGSGL